jgi:hypothetical protein
MKPRAGFVNAKILGYVFMIQLKTRINEEARKAGADQRDKQAYRNYPFEHWRKGNSYINR